MLSIRKWIQGRWGVRPLAPAKGTKYPFYGWWVVAVGSLVNALGTVHFQGFSVLFLPLTRELGLSRQATSLAFSVSRSEGALEGPVAGYLIDRLGARPMLIAGAIMAGVGYILFSRIDSFLTFVLVYAGIISVGFNAGFSQAVIAAANTWFVRRRGLAMSMVLSAGPLGATFFIPLLSLAVHHLGWRQAVVWVGVTLLAIAAPISLLVRRSPESMGLLPDGDMPGATGGANAVPITASVAARDYTVREAMATPAYWYLSLATMLRVAVISSITVHFIPIMVWRGMEEQTAAIMLGLLSLISIPMRLAFGWLGDRWGRTWIIALALGAGVPGLYLLYSSPAQGQLWFILPSLAAAEAAGPVNWALVGDFFGRRRFATLRGVMSFFYTWGTVILPVVAGGIYDRTQSYSLALWLFMAILGLSALVFPLLRPPQNSNGGLVR